MASLDIRKQLARLLALLEKHPEGLTSNALLELAHLDISERTLDRRLAVLIQAGKVRAEGQTNQRRYLAHSSAVKADQPTAQAGPTQDIPLSSAANLLLTALQQPLANRMPVGYNRAFLDHYQPNQTSYLSAEERARLGALGRTGTTGAAAGTYARQILGRLLIDLSWNSSRLEGNTYSLLDTRRLLAEGATPSEKSAGETQMILNHKDAIEFLVENRDDAIGINRHTLTSLHALLSNNLLPNPGASGRLRTMAVGISSSVYTPTAIPQLIEECFESILAKANAVSDPFEQVFFLMVHLPYLQPFDDVNKRVSRLAVNIPLNRHNLAPLTFTDVPRDLYAAGLLGVYERNDIQLLKEVFFWAYERSAARYAAVRQTLGEPNPFRLQYRDQLRTLIQQILVNALPTDQASQAIKTFSSVIPEADRTKFIEAVDEELLHLHEGNFARYRVTPAQFARWKQSWNGIGPGQTV